MKTHKAWFIRYQGPESEWVPAEVAQGLREALIALQSDCKQGSWITPERWLQINKALAAADGEVGGE